MNYKYRFTFLLCLIGKCFWKEYEPFFAWIGLAILIPATFEYCVNKQEKAGDK